MGNRTLQADRLVPSGVQAHGSTAIAQSLAFEQITISGVYGANAMNLNNFHNPIRGHYKQSGIDRASIKTATPRDPLLGLHISKKTSASDYLIHVILFQTLIQ